MLYIAIISVITCNIYLSIYIYMIHIQLHTIQLQQLGMCIFLFLPLRSQDQVHPAQKCWSTPMCKICKPIEDQQTQIPEAMWGYALFVPICISSENWAALKICWFILQIAIEVPCTAILFGTPPFQTDPDEQGLHLHHAPVARLSTLSLSGSSDLPWSNFWPLKEERKTDSQTPMGTTNG